MKSVRLKIPLSFRETNDWKLCKSLKKGTRYLDAKHLFSKFLNPIINIEK
jgi:hypothetical protein